ncbi:MAG: glycosyltransferase family 4 protein [Chthoniobacter sp.]|nr:glycosyltransferase family 4 protein [Chthoniobacter sp.]
MNILVLTSEFPPFPGGMGSYAYEVARAALGLGYDIEILAPEYPKFPPGKECDEPWTVHHYPHKRYRFWHTVGHLFRLHGLLRKKQWHLIHAVDPYWALCLAFVRRFMSFRYIATLHGSDVFDLVGAKKALVLAGGKPFERVDRVVTNSHFTKNLLLQHHSLPPELETRVTHLGVAPEWFAPVDPAVAAALKVRVPELGSYNIVLTVARLERRKGHLQVLTALDSLWESGIRDFCYVIAGKPDDDSYVSELRKQVASRPYPVHLVGVLTVAEVRAFYSLATVFCMPGATVPGRVEGFGLAYLEAAAQGLPAIACRLSAVPEVIKHGETGLLLEEGDGLALAAALKLLLRDTKERQRLSGAARQWAQTFTWRRCAEQTYGDFAA